MSRNTPASRRPLALAAEFLFVIGVIVAFVSTILRSIEAGYPVQPFIYNTFDTHMDWFNTAWWGAHDAGAGAYEVWGSIYPPISFVFLRFTTLSHCYVADSLNARSCDWLGFVSLYLTTLLVVIVIAVAFWRWDRVTAPMRTAALALSYPFWYALERGNLILVAFLFFFLAWAPNLIRSVRLKWLLAACAINFKVYLIATLAVPFARRRWLSLEVISVLTLLVYFFTYALYGNGLPSEIIENILYFADQGKTNSWQDVYYATSLTSIDRLFRDNALALRFIDSDVIELVLFVLPKIVLFGQLSCVFAIVATWLRPSSAPPHRLVAISVALALMTSEAGGYCYLLLIAFVFFERWEGGLRITALIIAYLLCLLADWVLAYVAIQEQFSFWAGHDVQSRFGVAIGHFLRPMGLVAMTACLAWLTILTCARTLRRDFAAGRPLFDRMADARPVAG